MDFGTAVAIRKSAEVAGLQHRAEPHAIGGGVLQAGDTRRTARSDGKESNLAAGRGKEGSVGCLCEIDRRFVGMRFVSVDRTDAVAGVAGHGAGTALGCIADAAARECDIQRCAAADQAGAHGSAERHSAAIAEESRLYFVLRSAYMYKGSAAAIGRIGFQARCAEQAAQQCQDG